MKKVLDADESTVVAWGGTCKSSDLGVVEGKAIVFGSEDDTDISYFRDFFDSTTYVHPEEEFTTPLFLEHGLKYKQPIGKAKVYKTDNSWNAIAELNMALPVVQERFADIKACKYGFSSGSAGHVVERSKKGNGSHHITQWPCSELSLTLTPAEPKALIHSVKSLYEWYGEDNLGSEITVDENTTTNEIMDDKLMRIIEMLVMELTKKSIEQYLEPQLEEIKNSLTELKSVPVPIDTGEAEEKLTVLKSENDELKNSLQELQSSFNEKEALLSEKMVLLSEIEANDSSKSEDEVSLAEQLVLAKAENEKLEEANKSLLTSLEQAKKINLALGKTNFNK